MLCASRAPEHAPQDGSLKMPRQMAADENPVAPVRKIMMLKKSGKMRLIFPLQFAPTRAFIRIARHVFVDVDGPRVDAAGHVLQLLKAHLLEELDGLAERIP
jgi:hypothetical protein